MRYTTHRPLSACLCGILVLLTCSTAWAQVAPSKLIKYAPKSSGLIIGVDVEKSKATPTGKAVLAHLRQNPKAAEASNLLSTMGIEPERDIKSLVLAGPSPKSMSASALSKKITVVVSGTFKKEAVLKGVKEAKYASKEIGGLTVYTVHSTLSASMVNDHTLVVIRGNISYTKSAWKNVAVKTKSGAFTGRLASRLKRTNQKANTFLVADAAKFKQKKDTPQLRYAMMDLELQKGMKISMDAELTSKEEAVEGLKDLETARPNALSLTMLFGFPGVAQNLTMTQKSKYITIKTSASEQETARIIGLIKRKASQ